MRTIPFLLITLHLSQMGFTLVRTFIKVPLENIYHPNHGNPKRNFAAMDYNPVRRQKIAVR
jgi:hypothetical protein